MHTKLSNNRIIRHFNPNAMELKLSCKCITAVANKHHANLKNSLTSTTEWYEYYPSQCFSSFLSFESSNCLCHAKPRKKAPRWKWNHLRSTLFIPLNIYYMLHIPLYRWWWIAYTFTASFIQSSFVVSKARLFSFLFTSIQIVFHNFGNCVVPGSAMLYLAHSSVFLDYHSNYLFFFPHFYVFASLHPFASDYITDLETATTMKCQRRKGEKRGTILWAWVQMNGCISNDFISI